jgi:flagellar protein FlaI
MVLEKIKNLRGYFYRKITEKEEKVQKEPKELPGFSIKKPKRMIEFPKVRDITEINVTYQLIEPFAYANIKWDDKSKEVVYNLIEPGLNKREKKLLDKISEALIELIEVGVSSIKETSRAIEYLEKQVSKIIKEFGLTLKPNQYIKIMYYIYRDFLGYGKIEALLKDPNIEDISCDGINLPVYVIHRKFGSLRTNIVFKDLEKARDFVIKLAERCGRYVTYAEPILDGTLPDGSRVSATLAGDVAPRGPTFTIRKFGEKPFSPVEQVVLGTVSSEILAYYWYLIEHGSSMFITGGTATGKTSFLNTLCMFIPPEAKIVSIEDTREIRIPHEHWIPGLVRTGFGIPLPTGEKYGEVTLFDLLKESFRQNPDYVVVGEVRGQEAYVMFQGMASGHPCLSTFHSGSIDTLIKRLTTPPIELSVSLIESLDVITIMAHAREKGKSARRIKKIVEVESIDPKTGEVKTRPVFEWDPVTDSFKKIGESLKLKNIVATRGGKLEDALIEIEKRRRILEWLREEDKKDYLEVTKIINQYYKEPNKILQKISKGVPLRVEKPIRIERKPRRRVSVLDLLGFKFIREK